MLILSNGIRKVTPSLSVLVSRTAVTKYYKLGGLK